MDEAVYQRVLGDEIRKARKSRGWTRKDLNAHLQTEISLQTLATYELGTRHCSVVRFAEICQALDVLPHDLLGRVHERVFTDAPAGHIRVDLRRAAHERARELAPLRRWAIERLAEHDDPTAVAQVDLDAGAVAGMAQLCGLTAQDLVERLGALSRAPL